MLKLKSALPRKNTLPFAVSISFCCLSTQQQALLPKRKKLKITIIYNILIQTKVMFTQNN